MTVADLDTFERLIVALIANTRASEDLTVAVLTLTQQLLPRITFDGAFRPEGDDSRPIEERDRPVPTIHQEDT